jgi:diguanylate cyclase (GGDEF)-like protein
LVAERQSQSVFLRLQELGHSETQPLDTVVPLDDYAIFYLVASEMARMAISESTENLYLFLDGQTAMQVDAVDGPRVAAKNVYVFGQAPESWSGAKNWAECDYVAGHHDQFLIIISPAVTFALAGAQDGERFSGAWTCQNSAAKNLARSLLAGAGLDVPALFENPEHDSNRGVACSMRLMSLLTRQLMLRQRDIAKDKDDLSSVLNILKAVSAKRRAHDILYVFVQQIARAVQMDRCSVVRVWGGDERGHVLASHEDESITDLAIDLRKYPEIHRAMETRQKVIINDAQHDPLTRHFSEDLNKAGFNAVLVIPVVLFDQNVGSFLLRAAKRSGSFSLREVSFCEIVAEAAANALERAHLFESIQKANERLEYLAVTDGLTGLYNHRYFRQRFEEEFERARRYLLPLSCMIIDVDNFKSVNDTYGHLQGDAVLRTLAACTLQSVRKSDIVARYGGEEIVVIMPQTPIDGARIEAERVRREIEETHFEGIPEERRITVSVGVAEFDQQEMLDSEALIRLADGALYRAKHEGKNKVVVGNQKEGNP